MDAAVKDRPEVFTGISFAVAEIVEASKGLTAEVRDLDACCGFKQPVAAKVCAEQVQKLSGQINTLAGVVAKALAQHVNSQPKVRI